MDHGSGSGRKKQAPIGSEVQRNRTISNATPDVAAQAFGLPTISSGPLPTTPTGPPSTSLFSAPLPMSSLRTTSHASTPAPLTGTTSGDLKPMNAPPPGPSPAKRPSFADALRKAPDPSPSTSAPSGPPKWQLERTERAKSVVAKTKSTIENTEGTGSSVTTFGDFPQNYYPKRRYSVGTLQEAATLWSEQGTDYRSRTGHLSDSNEHGQYVNFEKMESRGPDRRPIRHNVHWQAKDSGE